MIPINQKALDGWRFVLFSTVALTLAQMPLRHLAMQCLAEDFAIEESFARGSAKQRAFADAFFTRRGPDGRKKSIFAAIGGNRSGKTIACCPMTFSLYLRECAKSGDTFWCVCQTLDRSIGGQQRELWNALPRSMFGAQTWDAKIGFGMHRKVMLATKDGGKCVVEFRSADQAPSTFEQAKLRGIWVDERLPEEIFDRLLPRIIDTDGFILYSDIPEQWWQWERLFCAKQNAGIYCVGFEMQDNAHNLPAGAITETMARMTKDQIDQRVLGKFMVMQGVVFKEFDVSRHVCKPFVIPKFWPRWRMIDYGSSAETACPWVAMSEDEILYIYREHYEVGNIPHNAKMIVEKSGVEVYRETFMDPHAIDTPPAVYGMAPTVAKQYEDAGIRSRGWPYINVLGEHACVQKVKFWLENGKIKAFNNCVNMIREFKSWKYKCDKEGKPLASDAYENGNNHLIDCIKGFLATNPTYTPNKIDIVV